MDFLKYSLEMEEETKNYYLELAEKCVSNEGVKNILIMLAGEHDKHSEAFKKMEADTCTGMDNSDSFKAVDKLFKSMKENKATFSCDIDQVELYKKALNLVSKKYEFYNDALQKVDCPDNKAVIKQIAEEEKHQKYVIENIVEMVTRPDVWVENAEFYHFEEY